MLLHGSSSIIGIRPHKKSLELELVLHIIVCMQTLIIIASIILALYMIGFGGIACLYICVGGKEYVLHVYIYNIFTRGCIFLHI